MRIRQACAYMVMTGGMLLFAGGASQAEQSQSGTRAGTEKSEPVIDSNPSKGPSDLRLFDDHGPFDKRGPFDGPGASGKIGQEGAKITGPKIGGEGSRGGSGSAPAHSFGESRTGSSAGSMPGSHSGTGSMGSFGGGHSGAFGGR